MGRFGTDGLRGRANEEVTPELAMTVGNAVARVLGPRLAVAMDPRVSSPMLEAAVVAGIAAAGGAAVRFGELPTPGLSALVPRYGLDGGLMITASHNPPLDNGIKALDRKGRKLSSALLDVLQQLLDEPLHHAAPGTITTADGAVDDYMQAVLAVSPGGTAPWLAGHRLVLDTANGAARAVAPRVLAALGAEVIQIGAGSGEAINVGCGATHPAALVAKVRETGADAGIALDGDGDRVLLVTGDGTVLDGDDLLFLCADGPVVVGTVMTNRGLELALLTRGIRLVRTQVGDAHVAQAMLTHGAKLGGEPSGHILFSDGLPTSDGLLAALRALYPNPHSLAARRRGYVPHAVSQAALRVPPDNISRCTALIAELEMAGARVVVRPSGTEPVVRVLVEHLDPATAAEGLDRIAAVLNGAPV